MARVAEYLRRSSYGEEDKNYSLENQHDDVARWIGLSGDDVVQTYSDPGGKSDTLNRPVFQQMMADAKAGLFDTLVVGRWDRFSRNQDQQAVAVYQLERYGVKVVSATQPTPDGPIGTLIRNNYAFAAELELYNIRERTTAGKRKRVEKGLLPPMSYPRYGYLFADETKGRYIEDPDTAWVVRRIFDLVISGVTLRKIVFMFEGEGIPTPSQILSQRGQLGKDRPVSPVWHGSTLHHMLKHKAYIGKLEGNRYTRVIVERTHPVTGEVIEKRRQVTRPDDDPLRMRYAPEVCPALVDEATFEAAQVILARNKDDSVRNLRDPEALLLRNGFGVCGYCGGHLVGVYSKADHRYRYFCSKASKYQKCPGRKFSWRPEELDNMAWQWVMHNFEHPEVIRKKYEQWKAERDEGRSIEQDQLEEYEKAIAKAEGRKRNFMVSAGEATNDEMRGEWSAKANEEALRVKNLRAQYDALFKVLNQQEQQDEALESLVALGQRALDHLRTATFDDKRTTLYAFKVKVRAWSKDHKPPYEISWGFDALHEYWVQNQMKFSVPTHL